MDRFNQLSDDVNGFFETQFQQIPEVFQAPGAAYVLLGAIGVIYMIFGLKVYKFVLALIMLGIAGGLTYFWTRGDLLISVLVGLAAGLVAFLLQYIFVLLIAGIVFAGIAFIGLYAWLQRADLPLIAACIMIGVGIYLAVKLFKFIIIFSTSAIGAACLTGSFWVLWQRGESLGIVTENVEFDPGLFVGYEFTVGLMFAGCLLFGILVQSLMLAFKRRPAAKAEED
jgi:hypothetical protein